MVPYPYLERIVSLSRPSLVCMSIIQYSEDFFFRVYRIIGRWRIAHSNDPRPASFPFISGDGFRSLAKHVFDNTTHSFDATKVTQGEIIFVGNGRIQEFLTTIHPHIASPYVLITHNGDAQVDKTLFELAESKVIKWYGINITYRHPKLIPIPLGIENKYLYVCGIPDVFKSVIRQNRRKQDKIFYGFTVSTNPSERQIALDIISKHPQAETIAVWRGFLPYLKLLSTYKMVLSPPGSSTEGHRTWDTLYIGGVPIVKSSITIDYFKSLGVPLLVVTDWQQLDTLDAKVISDTYETTWNTSNKETLYFDYWKEKILNHHS